MEMIYDCRFPILTGTLTIERPDSRKMYNKKTGNYRCSAMCIYRFFYYLFYSRILTQFPLLTRTISMPARTNASMTKDSHGPVKPKFMCGNMAFSG